MDPISALGLAANIFQFVELAFKVVGTAKEIHESSTGLKADLLLSKETTQDIQYLSRKLCPAKGVDESFLSKDELMLKRLGMQCYDISEELLSKIESLRPSATSKVGQVFESMFLAVRSMWTMEDLNDLQLRLDRVKGQIDSIHIMNQFNHVSEQLSSLVSGVNSLNMNSSRARDIHNLEKKLYKLSHQIQTRGVLEGSSARGLSAAQQEAARYSAEQYVLELLRFPVMDGRFIVIKPAHEKTFSWALDSQDGTISRTNDVYFRQWLQSDESAFWVTGYPGTGKSTLMKYLATHEQTKSCLESWAQGSRVVVADFYFFNLGHEPLQKSLEGLLRTLLYKVLSQCPDLTIAAFPQHVQAFLTYGSLADTPEDDKSYVPQLLAALEQVFKAAEKQHDIRFCFFIDGLDEFEGQPDDIIRLVQILESTSNVKVCVSSRPWNEFEKAFGHMRKVLMETLTGEDIKTYVQDTLGSDRDFQDLKEIEAGAEALVDDIVNGARGVFLWVVLVVKQLLSGLTNGVRMQDLQKRVRDLPPELDQYFHSVLFTVDDPFRTQGAHLFRVTLEAEHDLALMTYYFIDQDSGRSLQSTTTKPTELRIVQLQLKQMRKRLNACCKGLLRADFSTVDDEDEAQASSILFSWTVDFYHRSVRDFLRTATMYKTLLAWSDPSYSVNRTICEAVITQVRTCPQDMECFREEGPVTKLLILFDHHLRILKRENSQQATISNLTLHLNKTFDELDQVRRLRGSARNAIPPQLADIVGDHPSPAPEAQRPGASTSVGHDLKPTPTYQEKSKRRSLRALFSVR